VATSGQPAAPDVGVTVGVEEEFHVVDAQTFAMLSHPALGRALHAEREGVQVSDEISTTQVETATAVCQSLAELRQQLIAGRAAAAAVTAELGATVLAASTHPFSSWQDQRLVSAPRYLELLERWGLLALQQDICGTHVHVGVPDVETAVAVMDRVRPYLPVVAALTGSSPFHAGSDTGYESFRTQWFARWPITGPTEPCGDAAAYLEVVESLRVAGVIDDASHLYWDVRPSTRYPTVEYRVGDVCTTLDDAVLHAGLLRSLTRVVAARATAGTPPATVRPELLRAARWRAARYGVTDELFDFATGTLVPGRQMVQGLLEELRDDLESSGEWDEVCALTDDVLRRGTSATRQRALMHRTSDPAQVAAMLVAEGLAQRG
jgi:YbdK family carboxylate-amine ligase